MPVFLFEPGVTLPAIPVIELKGCFERNDLFLWCMVAGFANARYPHHEKAS